MANSKFEDLALQYVLTDESGQEREISEKTAAKIEESANSRLTVGQWVASINRWIQPADDSSDDDFIARAKALDFLASTLEVLRRNDSALKADQVKLLVTFFGSLFASDHRGGVSASAKALRHLVSMKAFQPNLGNSILGNVCKLGDDFKLQTPATRLQLYELFLELLRDPSVANDLEHQYGNTCGFMTGLLDLCRNERDPQNLMKWFETLKIFLQNFSASTDITIEVFKTYSAYFPISLRTSATPSGITAEDLKGAVRSCFAAHYRVANEAIPFLVNKLDQGDAVTVAVKVDILQTLDACLTQYDHPEQSVVPFVDRIWSSLKYEVRNGENPDIIKATLKVISSLTRRLDADELRSFLASAWRDLVEDLSNPTYTASAGRLLVAIIGASVDSFAAIIPQTLSHIQSELKNTKSISHKQDLLTLLDSLLVMRSHLIDSLKDNIEPEKGPFLLKDELFGDKLFFQVYLPMWEESSTSQTPAEQVGILKKVMEGVATLMGQQSGGGQPSHRLCSDSACQRVVGWLANPSIACPLEARNFNESITDGDSNQGIRDTAAIALRKAVPLYPPAFQMLLQQYLSSIKLAYEMQVASHELALEIKLVATTLCEIGCLDLPSTGLTLLNPISLINALLEGLLWVLSERTPSRYWTAFVCSIHLAIMQTLESLSNQASSSPQSTSQGITSGWYAQFKKFVEDGGAPQIDLNKVGNLESTSKILEGLETDGTGVLSKFSAYCLWVVEQLYRRFTTVHYQSDETHGKRWNIGLSKDFVGGHGQLIVEQDVSLHQLGLLAASVVRVLNGDEQRALKLDKHAFVFFHTLNVDNPNSEDGPFPGIAGVSPLDEYRSAPLSMGILQGLYPGVLSPRDHFITLKNLCAILSPDDSPCSDTTRAALDMIFTILSNKILVEDRESSQRQLELQQGLIYILTKFWSGTPGTNLDHPTALRIFRSILHFLAGDVARFRTGPGDPNEFLWVVCKYAPLDPTMGRELAKSFEVLVSPKECLDKENHAIRKRLSGEWLYFQAVQPYLKDCFPGPDVDEGRAVNRAVAVFAILKHLRYEQYASEIEQIVRIGIRSLSTFDVGAEMESCLSVLLHILDKDPEVLKEHLAGLISGMAAVYDKARQVAKTTVSTEDPVATKARGREAILCRKFALEFFQKLPRTYEARYLVPYRQQLLRPLSAACGDSVREIRRAALMARQAWNSLA
ncbi:Dos2-interacting transcription regulator of RNA-Pol-II-domain-containing protein [Xylariaceae sp. FL0662B]|nr:Dos2-interacting transcription regulator of RNA-Pol-II-domain-containing protein [Xylariaceae sp. FL0662B]